MLPFCGHLQAIRSSEANPRNKISVVKPPRGVHCVLWLSGCACLITLEILIK